jgi:hypothetical protein
MVKALVAIILTVSLHIFSMGVAEADGLLRVDGGVLKWEPRSSGASHVITYTVLTGPYTVPSDKKTLSPDNCDAMHAFSDIVAASPDVSGEAAMGELRSALEAWSQAANVSFVETSDARHANIVIGAADNASGRAFANLSYRSGPQGPKPVAKALGKAERDLSVVSDRPMQKDAVAAIDQAYVCLNPRARWKVGFDGNLKIYDLRYTFTHEVGHAIGLDHPGREDSLMNFRYDERVRELQPTDIAAAQMLYGPRKRQE